MLTFENWTRFNHCLKWTKLKSIWLFMYNFLSCTPMALINAKQNEIIYMRHGETMVLPNLKILSGTISLQGVCTPMIVSFLGFVFQICCATICVHCCSLIIDVLEMPIINFHEFSSPTFFHCGHLLWILSSSFNSIKLWWHSLWFVV